MVKIDLEGLTDEQVDKLKVQFREYQKDNQKIDFSKFIWKWTDCLAIKWEKYLMSYNSWNIGYSNKWKLDFTEEIKYIETILDKLVEWDIYVSPKLGDIYMLEDFKIFIGVDEQWYYRSQYLETEYWLELINRYYHWSNLWEAKVIKFLRN